MSVQFNVVRISVTTGPADMIGHNGEQSVNEDFPIGTVLCYDKSDNLFYCVDPNIADIFRVKGNARQTKKPITLYRDYWRHIASGANTPYGASIRNAAQRTVQERI